MVRFRASEIGHIAQCLESQGLTSRQAQQLEEYEIRSEKAIKQGAKPLTDRQGEEMAKLLQKRDAKPQLSEGAKSYIKKLWLRFEKGYNEEISNKYLSKGIQAEEVGISLISDVDGVFYVNNNKDGQRITKGLLTGQCDVLTIFKTPRGPLKVVDDIKCSWNPLTFMGADLCSLYRLQGHSYLYLYDADIFRLRYCLVNCPPDVFMNEFKKYCFQHEIIDETAKQYSSLVEQFFVNYIYDFEDFEANKDLYPEAFAKLTKKLTPKYTKEERVKTFEFERDEEVIDNIKMAMELAMEYYEGITLNMK